MYLLLGCLHHFPSSFPCLTRGFCLQRRCRRTTTPTRRRRTAGRVPPGRRRKGQGRRQHRRRVTSSGTRHNTTRPRATAPSSLSTCDLSPSERDASDSRRGTRTLTYLTAICVRLLRNERKCSNVLSFVVARWQNQLHSRRCS